MARRKADPQGGEFGTAAYDATMHPANAALQSILAGKIQAARDIHLFGDKFESARVYSHVYDAVPSPVAIQMMGLAAARDQIERTVQRVNDLPFPGVPLGHTPGFHAAPNVQQVVGRMAPLGHHSHLTEPEVMTRRRFGS